MKGSLCKYVAMASWVITALVSVNFGLGYFGQDYIYTNTFLGSNLPFVQLVVLVAGLFSCYMIIMAYSGKCGGCSGKKSCKC